MLASRIGGLLKCNESVRCEEMEFLHNNVVCLQGNQ